MLVIAGFVVFNFYQKNGDIMHKDVSLKGGITATVYTDKEVSLDDLGKEIEKAFGDHNIRKLSEFGSNRQIGIIIEVGDLDEAKLKSLLESFFGLKLEDKNYSVEVVGSSLGASFYSQMSKAILFAFILMAIVVVAIYRTVVPSCAVIFAAFTDIFVTLAVVDLIGLRIGTAGIAAFLLLIGYSVDTDMLLTTKVLRRRELKLIDRVFEAITTGLTMTTTTLVALVAGYFISTSPILKEMFLIIFIGLLIDVIATYGMNAPLLIWHAKRKGI